jgi:hypothetical protein
MLWLLADLQKVELIGGESWVAHNSVAFAAIAAATLAATVAILNRRAELKHDRDMRNRDHTRDVIDQSYVQIAQTIKEVSELMGMVQGTEISREEAASDPNSAPETSQQKRKVDQELDTGRDRMHPIIMDLFTTSARLEMRLGEGHPVAETHHRVRSSIAEICDRAPSSLDTNRGPEEREIDNRYRAKSASAHTEFRRACFNWLNQG